VVLQVGDHDPAGEEIFGALAADVTAFLADDAPEAKVQFIRVAVTPDQIAMYGLRPRRRHSVRANSRRTRTDRWHAERFELAVSAERALALGWLNHCSIVPPVPDGPRSVRYRAELRPFVCPLSRHWSVIGPGYQPFCRDLLAFC
jgi:hypothetical protein